MLNFPKIKGQFLNQHGSPRFASEAGVFPLFLLVAIGVALVGGGAYAVKNNLVTTKNGQIVFNANELKLSANKPKDIYKDTTPSSKNTSSNNSPIPKKAELSQNSAEFKPDTGEPKFSITPPAGWIKVNKEGKVKLFFEASQEDKKVFGNSTTRSTANIEVTSEKSSAKSLDEIMAKLKKEADNYSAKIEFSNEQKTTFAGYDAIRYEASVSMTDLNDTQIEAELKKAGNKSSVQDVKDLIREGKVRGVGFVLLKDGYDIGVGGTALNSAWDKRGPVIEASLNSFKFLDDNSKTVQSPSSPSVTSSSVVSSGWATVPNYSFTQSSGWKKTKNFDSGRSHTTTYEFSKDPDIQLYVELKEDSQTNYKAVIDKFIYDSAFHKAKNHQKVINGLEGYNSDYEYYQSTKKTYYHTHQFKSYKNGFEILISVASSSRNWDIYQENINKFIDSFKLE